MKHLSILVPNGKGNNLSSIVGPYKILSRANEYWKNLGRKQMFKIELVGQTKRLSLYDGAFTVKPHVNISALHHTNLIIIPSLNHHYKEALLQNKKLADWVAVQYQKGAEVASICTGAFLLASTGLLNDMICSTHWSAANELQALFPSIKVRSDQLITDENGIYTNGGAYSFLNLMVYLVEKYFDRQTALYCSKVFQIEMDRQSQSPFIIFAGQKQHEDEMVKAVQTYIEENAEDKISAVQLSTRFSVSRRNLDRRFFKATGNTPLEYAQRVKIERAKKALESGNQTIAEVMYHVGYTDSKAFREVFRKITGLSPMEYRNKYKKSSYLAS